MNEKEITIEILTRYMLKNLKANGLFNDEIDCECYLNENFMICGMPFKECTIGYKNLNNRHLSPRKNV